MPIISDQMKKAAKRQAAEEKKRKEAEEHRLREEQAKKEQEEREAKEKEEQENRQKKLEKRQKRKDRIDKHKRAKQELERKANMRKEMAFIRKTLGPKQIKDETGMERQGVYILRTEVKSGKFSKIYKAKMADNENMICKVLILEKTPPPYRKNLLENSLRIQRYLGGGATDVNSTKGYSEPKHAGLLKVFDIFVTDTKAYIFMEEVDPKSVITAKFKKGETSDENEVKKAVRELALTLQYLHCAGVAVNNLRTSHVVYTKENQLKLIGLNMCCFYWDSDMETVVPQKRVSKKEFEKYPNFPPEVFKEETYDPSLADIWSLGVIMCQMIANENPFKIKSEQPFEEQWKAFAQTKQFSDEAKQFLDRIFVEPKDRPNITDLLDDSYLKTGGTAAPTVKPTKESAEKEGSTSSGPSQEKNASADTGSPAAPGNGTNAGEDPPKS